MNKRKILLVFVFLAAVIVLAFVYGSIVKSGSTRQISTSTSQAASPSTTQSTTSSTSLNGNLTTSIVPFNGRIVNVLNFGADSTGVKDSRSAILSALLSAEEVPGSELYFPAGTYVLKSMTSPTGDFVVTAPIRIVGAGVASTTIVNAVGQNTGVTTPPPMFLIKGTGTPSPGAASGTLVQDLKIDCAKYQSGTAIIDFADNTAIESLLVYAPTSSDKYNPNQFGVRVIAVCNRNNYQTIYRTGNIVQDVTIIGTGKGGNTELDISCQKGSSVSNVTIQGNGVDVYLSQDVTLSNLKLTGGVNGQKGFFTWVVVGSHNVTLSNIVATGEGGVIRTAPHSPSTNVTVTNEVMTDKSKYIFIGDANGVKVLDSQLGGVDFVPAVSTSNVNFVGTTFGGVRCPSIAKVNGLVGITCG